MKKALFILVLFFCFGFAAHASDITVRDIDSEAWLEHINYMGQIRRQILRTLTKDNPTIHDKRVLKNLEHAFDKERERWNQYLVDLVSGITDKPLTDPDRAWLKDHDDHYLHRKHYEQRRIRSAAYHSRHRRRGRGRARKDYKHCCCCCCCNTEKHCCCNLCETE